MAGNNPLAPPGGAPTGGGPVAQPGPAMVQSRQNSGLGRGPGASILAPGPPPQPPSGQAGPPPASKTGQPFADVHQQLKYSKSQFDQGQKAQQILDHLRVELDGLMEMGDTVRPENVIEAAGRLVGHGIGATQLAQIMSDMPAMGGEGLASWIRAHDVTVSNAEQQLAQENAVLQHRMGVAGIKSLAATHLHQEMMQGARPIGPAPSNSLMGSGPPAGGQADEAS